MFRGCGDALLHINLATNTAFYHCSHSSASEAIASYILFSIFFADAMGKFIIENFYAVIIHDDTIAIAYEEKQHEAPILYGTHFWNSFAG